MRLIFNRRIQTRNYEILFNTKTGLELIQGRNGKPDPKYLENPVLLDIGIMGHCNNNCRFCYQGNTREPHMSLKNFKLIIDQIKDYANQVALGGRGDPNEHPNFKDIVEYTVEKGVVPNYTTSGKNLTKEHIEISKLCGAVAVSDYEEDFTYRAIRGLIENGIKTNIHIIFSSISFDNIRKILYSYNPWNIDINSINAVILLLFKPQGNGKDLSFFKPSKYQINIIKDLLDKEEIRKELKIKVGVDSCLANYIKGNVKTESINQLATTCEASRMSTYISPSMKMVPCSFLEASNGITITKKNTISKIWKTSELFKSFRDSLEKNPNICPIKF